jgi:hypothetical protein
MALSPIREKTHTVETRSSASIYRVAVDGSEFLVDGRRPLTNYFADRRQPPFEVEVDIKETSTGPGGWRNYHIDLVDEADAPGGLQLGTSFRAGRT